MHRHGYQGRKFHRERDQRRALIKGLADSLVKYETIETTLPKAKAVVPYMEKLITKAKKGDLHNRRQVIAKLQTIASAHKLFDEITPKLAGRNSGHLRVVRTSLRRGDNAQLARVSFVDDLKSAPVATSAANKTSAKPTTTAAASTAASSTAANRRSSRRSSAKPAAKPTSTTAKPAAATRRRTTKKESA
jgi:large subunit ribosomal protein L17